MAKIDTTKIEGYSEMTLEEKIAALEAYEYEDYSSELERYKNAVSKANSEAAMWKKKYNAFLSEEERKKNEAEEEMNKIREELEILRKEKLESDHRAKLIALGYDENLAAETAKALVNGETEKLFVALKKHQETLEKQIRADVLKDTPKPKAGSGTKPEITKEQFDEMNYTERLKLFADNPELYKEFTGGNE
ncbi:MAG TPA: hypothetical protein PKI14_08065 [Fervidobacterium sp.]|nr:hypothetical protein [Fervidobacterium sp.]